MSITFINSDERIRVEVALCFAFLKTKKHELKLKQIDKICREHYKKNNAYPLYLSNNELEDYLQDNNCPFNYVDGYISKKPTTTKKDLINGIIKLNTAQIKSLTDDL